MNHLKIIPIPVPYIDPKSILGYDMFPNINAEIAIMAKKNSGKTNVIFAILKHCINDTTKVFIFSSTCEKDPNWLYIRKWLEKNKIEYECFMDLDPLNDIIKNILAGETSEPIIEERPVLDFSSIHTHTHMHEKQKKKSKIQAPNYCFIFDDMSENLRMEKVSALSKKNRHLSSKVIISSQNASDLNVPARQQMDYWLLFAGHPIDKLKMMFKSMDLSIEFDQFLELYYTATSIPYGFLYIDVRAKPKTKFRINFTTPIDI